MRVPSVWSSSDGKRWKKDELKLRKDDTREEQLTAATRKGNVAVAFGERPDPSGDIRPVLWRSQDGKPWVPVALADSQFEPGRVESVAPFRSGFVAVGSSVGETSKLISPVAWLSPDGMNWGRATQMPERDVRSRVTLPFSVASGPSGLVATGESCPRIVDVDCDAMIWFSKDGDRWSKVGAESFPFVTAETQQIPEVVSFKGKFFATGTRFDDKALPTVWTSPDGQTWERLRSRTLPFPEDIEGGSGYRIAGDKNRLVISGEVDLVPRLWDSSDGIRWRERSVPNGAEWTHIGPSAELAVGNGRTVAAFYNTNENSLWASDDKRWTELTQEAPFESKGRRQSVIGLANHRGSFVAIGAAEATSIRPSAGKIWHSNDAKKWHRLRTPSFWRAQFLGIASFEKFGYFVYGTQRFGRAAIWTSKDGRGWNELRLPSSMKSVEIAGIVQAENQLIVAGTVKRRDSTDIAIWTSRDGKTWSSKKTLIQKDAYAEVICAGPRGEVLVIGSSIGGEGSATPGSWESKDAKAWKSARPTFATAGDGADLSFTECARNSSETAVIADLWGDSASWFEGYSNHFSLSKPAWNQHEALKPRLNSVLAHKSAFLVVGSEMRGNKHDVGIWQSGDGKAWKPLEGAEMLAGAIGFQEVWAITVADGKIVLGGAQGNNAAIWTGPLPDCIRGLEDSESPTSC